MPQSRRFRNVLTPFLLGIPGPRRLGPTRKPKTIALGVLGAVTMAQFISTFNRIRFVTEVVDQRFGDLLAWVRGVLGTDALDIAPASEDASFRRYFRVSSGSDTWIVMDAPPDKEPLQPFVRIAGAMLQIGLNVPKVLSQDDDKGFLLLSDLGSQQYLAALEKSDDVLPLYRQALHALVVLQADGNGLKSSLPPYDRALLSRELGLFWEWYVQMHLGLVPTDAETAVWRDTCELLCRSALQQPVVAVHRDYHSRNLMVSSERPGILDFQDAVAGPVTYDLVSLLEDCYIALPEETEDELIHEYRRTASDQGVDVVDEAVFLRDYDLMGIQRHLKAAGIFARLNHRDGKAGYLKDIPRTLAYVRRAASRHPALSDFSAFLKRRIPESQAYPLS